MGNANGSENSIVGDEVAESTGHAPPVRVSSADLMVSSPPRDPRQSRSPLLFSSQAPAIPLQRNCGPSLSNPLRQNDSQRGVDHPFEQGIPTIITWSFGGQSVAVEGSWDNWRVRKILQKSGKDHSILLVLPAGIFHYKFIVDGEVRYIPDLPSETDEIGCVCNLLDVNWEIGLFFFLDGCPVSEAGTMNQSFFQAFIFFALFLTIFGKNEVKRPDYRSSDSDERNHSFRVKLEGSFLLKSFKDFVPDNLDSVAELEAPASPDSSYGQSFPGDEDFGKDPGPVPALLQSTVLGTENCKETESSSKPQHVVLNHLYMEKGWSSESVVSLGLTHRFQSKYVTVVLYKPLKR
ncbi:hypothetical protein RD792_005898 [Penstemon davidsonii]|uniref:Association with the SNF1 complex (ASC) domain-containing protein n=1 Tax=Penstemon davidsonii TaxID=160366 RepID=A0ABR0DF62_9LAMI|nr:hypothetical protein RD792_005898 [Penstemon davidsonii]